MKMKTYESEEWKKNHDMPHEVIMDRLGLDFTELGAETQREVRLFDQLYETALKDGFVDELEEQQLITKSYGIAKLIEKEHGTGSNGSATVGFFAGALLVIGAAIGINQLTKL